MSTDNELRLLTALITGPTFARIMREILDEVGGAVDVKMLERYAGGTLLIVPPGDHQSKEIPIELFFKKIISVREKLRVLEQKINNHPNLTEADKIDLEQYITKANGSLTTFNFLFKDKEDYFQGSGGKNE